MKRKLAVLLLTIAICFPLGLNSFAAGYKEVINGIEYNYGVSGEISIVTETNKESSWPLLDDFLKLYPNIKVKKVLYEGSWNERWRKFVVAMKAGGQSAPDCIAIESQAPFKHSSYLEDLLKPPYKAGRIQGVYNPWVWRAMKNGKGNITMLQCDICTTCTWYRYDLFELCGLPTDPKSVARLISKPDTLIRTAEKLKAKGYYILDDQIWTYQGALGFRMADAKWKPIWMDPKYNKKFADAMTVYRDFKLRGLLGPSQWDYNNIKQTKYAMLPGCTWSWLYPIKDATGETENNKWRVTDPILGSYGTWGGSGWAISKTCKDKAAAWEFVKFMTTHPAIWKENLGLSIPAIKGLWKLDMFQKNPPEFANCGQNIWQELIRITGKYHDGPANSTPVDSAINGDWYSMLEDYMNNGGDIQAVMAKWAQKAMADVEGFRKKEGMESAIEWEQ